MNSGIPSGGIVMTGSKSESKLAIRRLISSSTSFGMMLAAAARSERITKKLLNV